VSVCMYMCVYQRAQTHTPINIDNIKPRLRPPPTTPPHPSPHTRTQQAELKHKAYVAESFSVAREYEYSVAAVIFCC